MLCLLASKIHDRIFLSFNRKTAMAKRVTVEGVQYRSISEASRQHNLDPSLVAARLSMGWTLHEALELINRPKTNSAGREIVVKGVKYAKIKDAAEIYGFSGRFIANRINLGLTPEQALELEPFPDWFVPGSAQKRIRDAEAKRLGEIKTGLKRCSTCKKEKPLSCFHGSHENSNISGRCQDCISAGFLKYRYGISVEQFNLIREKQDSRCAICKTELEIKKDSTFRSKKAAVDHCHVTGKIRGLLCSSCNKGLGLFYDNEALLASAIEYLEASKRQDVENFGSCASELDDNLAQ